MGIFDSSSTTLTTNKTENYSSGADGGSISGVGSQISITSVDGGAVDKLYKLSDKIVTTFGQANAQSQTFAQQASQNALDFAFNAGRPDAAITTKQIWVAGAVLIVSILAVTLNGGRGRSKKGKGK